MGREIIKIVHIAVHMGGGAGKAIAGLVCNCDKVKYRHIIILLEEPKEKKYVECCLNAGIEVLVKKYTKSVFCDADAIVINWWGHPLMMDFMQKYLSDIKSRWIIWSHINGCNYPYLPFGFLDKADLIMFTSNYSLENTLWGYDERTVIKNKAEIVYGMGEFLPDLIPQKQDFVGTDIKIGYVGTVAYSKMDREYLRLFKYLCDLNTNINFKLILVGEYSKEVTNDIEQLNLEQKVVCVGKVDDVYVYYQQFDIFLYLLREDNYATTENVLLEAMAVGLPIVVWNNEVEKNIIINGINGFRVSGRDELNSVIINLLDKDERRKIGNSARHYVKKEYSLNDNLQRYYSVISSVCKRDCREYPFGRFLTDNQWEWLVRFCGPHEEELRLLVANKKTYPRQKGKLMSSILRGQTKGSLEHFLRHYPNNKNMRMVYDFLMTNLKEGNYRK